MSRSSKLAQLSGTPYRRAVRAFLDKRLPLHSDLDAFCLDYFYDLTRRFGDGWDHLSKQSLLITTVPPDQLLAALASYFSKHPAAQNGLAEVRKLLLPEELERQARSAELEQLCETRATFLSEGHTTQELDARIRELKKQLREFPQLHEGEILGERYKLLCLLGKGGFARVYQAYDLRLRTLVAVKVLHSESSDDPHTLSRFERGARQMQQLSHPHIVRVLDGPAEQAGFHYFVMECLNGGDLAHAVKSGRLSALDKLRVVLEVGSALRFAHQRQLIHRDVKPENVLLDDKLLAKLTDFDLVWAADTTGGTRSRAGIGTYLYAATEQLTNASQVTASADIYGLAMLTFFVLAGEIQAWFRDYRQHAISSLPVNQPLQILLDRATHPSPSFRPSLNEFLRVASQCWPLSSQEEITATIRLVQKHNLPEKGETEQELNEPKTQQEQKVEQAEEKQEKTETVAKLSVLSASDPEQPKHGTAKVLVNSSVPESGVSLQPVEKADHSGPKHRSLRVTALFVLPVLAVGGYFGLDKLRQQEPVDSNVSARQLLVQINQDIQDKWWSNAIEKTELIINNKSYSQLLHSEAKTMLSLAKREQNNKKIYNQFHDEAGRSNYDVALRSLAELPKDSVYYQSAKVERDKIFPLYVDLHLQSAAKARAAGNCAEASALVQKILNIDSQQAQALAAKEQPCTQSVEQVLTDAQSEFVAGNYNKAISLARSVVTHSPNRAWRIIGAAACRSKDVPLVEKANSVLDNAARQYLIYVCQREGIVQNGHHFKFSAIMPATQATPKPPEPEPLYSGDPEPVLTDAQSEFVNGNYHKAISLARSVVKASPNRAWRITGAAACREKDLKLVEEAYRALDNAARQYLIYVCQREGIVQNGKHFKLTETTDVPQGSPDNQRKSEPSIPVPIPARDPEIALNDAQSEFEHQRYNYAISLAFSAVKANPNRAWRIIGASACRNKNAKQVDEAYGALDNAGRQYLINTCLREGIVQSRQRFRLPE